VTPYRILALLVVSSVVITAVIFVPGRYVFKPPLRIPDGTLMPAFLTGAVMVALFSPLLLWSVHPKRMATFIVVQLIFAVTAIAWCLQPVRDARGRTKAEFLEDVTVIRTGEEAASVLPFLRQKWFTEVGDDSVSLKWFGLHGRSRAKSGVSFGEEVSVVVSIDKSGKVADVKILEQSWDAQE